MIFRGCAHAVLLFQEFQNYTVAGDTFLAHLGATLWGSMRHIISPSIADGSFHYYEKISFQLFFITQEVIMRGNGIKTLCSSAIHNMYFLRDAEVKKY